MMPDLDDARRTLRDVFGFDDFREGQAATIGRLLGGQSSLAIFPTGAGKSLCYQLPALLLDGLTVVVSPLIALMKDQVDFLTSRGVAAARLDSSLEAAEAREVYAGLRSGLISLLYVAPERLASGRFVDMLAGRQVALLAVDEAHCISEWGHNFRPDYLTLAEVAERLRVGRVLALTATATPEVARDVADAFGIDPADVVRTGFHRPNLELHATPCTADERVELLRSRLRERPPGPAIVYVTLQRTAEEVADLLARDGHEVSAYHAGLADERRHEVQDRFMASDSMIVVATIAFGMGIDKANIRAVYHYNLPKGPENYAQEIGRAGRDGQPARCDLFACPDDVIVMENFAYGDTPSEDGVAAFLADVLGRGEVFDTSTYDLSQDHDIRPLVVETLLTYLELDGVIRNTGPFYAEMKLQLLRPREEILERFDDRRRAFLESVFGAGKQGRTWLTLDVPAASETLGESRERIGKALNYLEEQGDLAVQPSRLRKGFRRLVDEPDLEGLASRLSARFLEREAREVDRVRRMLDFAASGGCLSRRLLAYFGEDLGGDCGHCGPCLGEPARPVPPARSRSLGAAERRLVEEIRAEGREMLASPRQIARFLCGLSSPATTKARLTRDPRYGALGDVPFAKVLTLAGG